MPLKDWDINIYRGILTGYNEAFIIDQKTKDELEAKSGSTDLSEIIRPILRGKDIRKNRIEFADKWLLFIPWHFPLHNNELISGASELAEKAFIEQYPIIYNHLLSFKENLSKRNQSETGIRYEWYALQRCASTYYNEFNKEKIVYSEIVREPQFCIDNDKMFVNDTCFIMTGNNLKYITSLLNSKAGLYFYKKFYAGGGLGEDGIRYKKIFLEKLPLPKMNESIETHTQILLNNINIDPLIFEKEQKILDDLIFDLYNLDEDEKMEITSLNLFL